MSKLALTENKNPNTINIDMLDSLEIAKLINDEDKKVATAIEKELPKIAQAIELIADSFKNHGRLAYFGAGTSGRIGVLDASECPPTFGVSSDMVQGFIAGGDIALRFAVENSEDSAELALEDLRRFAPKKDDIIVSISASGSPNYVVEVLKKAKEMGLKTIGITSNPDAKMKPYADIFINPILGAEAVTGSSRMKSGTAQKLILNMLTTGAMIRIGKTYENYMIDLKISNAKLHDRGCRIISEIAQVPHSEAQKHLEASKNNVKVACVIAKLNVSATKAEELLNNAGGILRKVIN